MSYDPEKHPETVWQQVNVSPGLAEHLDVASRDSFCWRALLSHATRCRSHRVTPPTARGALSWCGGGVTVDSLVSLEHRGTCEICRRGAKGAARCVRAAMVSRSTPAEQNTETLIGDQLCLWQREHHA
ncbi:hypothetical protein DPEC_G00214920 [Dallia pectoralis]|uniref:Uncharacterized protein n=1 Tax=Dallia pectoralis TaxID=75939 RepID=A0ACC2G241_DALPE|nr:hypothetical protein DPEC_G00214920 [Dallia pectoralis]